MLMAVDLNNSAAEKPIIAITTILYSPFFRVPFRDSNVPSSSFQDLGLDCQWTIQDFREPKEIVRIRQDYLRQSHSGIFSKFDNCPGRFLLGFRFQLFGTS